MNQLVRQKRWIREILPAVHRTDIHLVDRGLGYRAAGSWLAAYIAGGMLNMLKHSPNVLERINLQKKLTYLKPAKHLFDRQLKFRVAARKASFGCSNSSGCYLGG